MISIVVLAAGRSQRFGSNKLLEKVNDKTMIEKVVDATFKSKVDKVVVVIGFEAEKITEALAAYNCAFILNEEYEKGQSYSVIAGVAAVARESEAVLILPGDIALITSKAIDQVVDEYWISRDPIVVASYKGRLGHPILFGKGLLKEVLEIKEENQGLRHLLRKYSQQIKKVDVDSPEVLIDIDTKEDFEKYIRHQIDTE